MQKKLTLALALCAALYAHADIPQLADTQCRYVRANGQPEKAQRCRVQTVSSAPRPNLPDVQSQSVQIGKRQYDFTAEYQADTQSWRYQHGDAPLTLYQRNGAFKKTRNAQKARYTCFQLPAVHFCLRKMAAPFW
nr:hypothetical protein [uncultured Kingella sp.]